MESLFFQHSDDVYISLSKNCPLWLVLWKCQTHTEFCTCMFTFTSEHEIAAQGALHWSIFVASAVSGLFWNHISRTECWSADLGRTWACLSPPSVTARLSGHHHHTSRWLSVRFPCPNIIMQSPCRTVPHMHNRQPRDTHLPSSSYSWYSSVKRVHVVVAMSSPLGLGLGHPSLRIKNRPQFGEQERPGYSPRFCAQKSLLCLEMTG